MGIKAIPWTYGGLNFRSKLEAKWYVAFKLLGFNTVEYEPCALAVSSRSKEFIGHWTPDFLLDGKYVEVKPLLETSFMPLRDRLSIRNAVVSGYFSPAIVILGSPRKFVAFEVNRCCKGNPEGHMLDSSLRPSKYELWNTDGPFTSWYPDEEVYVDVHNVEARWTDLPDFSYLGMSWLKYYTEEMPRWNVVDNMIQWKPVVKN